jgi:hypothetical protein
MIDDAEGTEGRCKERTLARHSECPIRTSSTGDVVCWIVDGLRQKLRVGVVAAGFSEDLYL